MKSRIILSHFGGLGDALMLCTVGKHLSIQKGIKVYVATGYPLITKQYNELIHLASSTRKLEWVRRKWKILGVSHQEFPLYYSKYFELEPTSEKHILSWMSEKVGLKNPIKRPTIEIQPEDLSGLDLDRTLIKEKVVAIHGICKPDAQQKQYPLQLLQEVILALHEQGIKTIQIGTQSDDPIGCSFDWRGKTTPLELTQVLKLSKTLLTHISFPMHLQQAIGGNAVVLYGCSELPQQSGYSNFINLATNIKCGPNWKNSCPQEIPCMNTIKPSLVVSSILSQLDE